MIIHYYSSSDRLHYSKDYGIGGLSLKFTPYQITNICRHKEVLPFISLSQYLCLYILVVLEMDYEPIKSCLYISLVYFPCIYFMHFFYHYIYICMDLMNRYTRWCRIKSCISHYFFILNSSTIFLFRMEPKRKGQYCNIHIGEKVWIH